MGEYLAKYLCWINNNKTLVEHTGQQQQFLLNLYKPWKIIWAHWGKMSSSKWNNSFAKNN